MDQVSDNFFAETLTKDVAVARRATVGSTRTGWVTLTRRYLHNLGIDLAGAQAAWTDPASRRATGSPPGRSSESCAGRGREPYGWYFRHALPLAGVQAKHLHDRMRSGPAYRNALAKTGTLDGASALSGYVTARETAITWPSRS